MLFLSCFLVVLVNGDVYMHNPRGSNDRNCERNVNRNNGNLLFDSQNNAKGGYACPRAVAGSNDVNALTQKMQFEEGSLLEVEWTSQHGCGRQTETPGPVTNEVRDTPSTTTTKGLLESASNVHCEMVIEMLCTATADPAQQYQSTKLKEVVAVPREGIPNSNNDAATNRANTNDPGQADSTNTNNARFGIHETPEYYNECNRVKRNRNLFTADQNVNRRSAIGTRQNPNGGRRGLECPEERDYYPYWRPSPFLGIAYLVDDPARCGSQQPLPCGGTNTPCQNTEDTAEARKDWVGNAQGLVAYSSCVSTTSGKIPKTSNGLTGAVRTAFNRREWPNNKDACDALGAAFQWKPMLFHSEYKAENLKNFNAVATKGPVCNVIDWSRSNHLGNSGGEDTASRFTMTMPSLNEAQTRTNAGISMPGEPCILRLRYNMSSSDYIRNLNSSSNGNDSPIQQDPLIKIGTGANELVQLALNTNQVARTFQDRSYVFYVTPRVSASEVQIINVNARGKRGNIVQTYPAVEYDFIPNRISATDKTQMAFQWVQSDYNPRRGCNDGEGGPYVGDQNVRKALEANQNRQGSNQNSRTDRMTLVEMSDSRKNYPFQLKTGPGELFSSNKIAMKFATADAVGQLQELTPKLQCLTKDQINAINNENQRENHPRNCAEGNAYDPYFSTEKISAQTGWIGKTKTLISPRNNNFSNRETKIVIWTTKDGTELPKPPSTGIISIQSFEDLGLDVQKNLTANPRLSDTELDEAIETDIPPFQPIENDSPVGSEGATEGCTQDRMVFSSAYCQDSHFVMIAFSVMFGYIRFP